MESTPDLSAIAAQREMDAVHGTRVLLITRAPVGGLWRHILDLTDGLLERGFELGVVVDSLRASDSVKGVLKRFEPKLALGVHTLDIPRVPGLGDVRVARHCRKLIKELKPDIVHGHGAKGGLHARLAAWGTPAKSFYTPHGGSLHYDWNSVSGAMFLSTERAFVSITNQFLFESSYSHQGFTAKIGDTTGKSRVIFNGLRSSEFAGSVQHIDKPDYDFAFVGEMRAIKGVDVLLDALDVVAHATGRAPKVLMLGDGPQMDEYKALAEELGIAEAVDFVGRRPVREAFAATNTIVVPSRAESLPYIVIESIAAGKNVIATDVGGIGEIFGPTRDALIPANDFEALADAMVKTLSPQTSEDKIQMEARYDFVATNFHVDTMVDQAAQTYHMLLQRD